MKFIYAPEGGDKQEFPFEPDRLMTSEAEAIESVTGMTFGEWREAILLEHSKAQRAFLWVCLKRQRPTLKFNELEFRMGEVAIDLDEGEIATVLEKLEESLVGKEPTAEQLEVLEELRASLPETAEPAAESEQLEDGLDVGDEGKAEPTPAASPTDVASASGPSPTA